MAYTPETDAGEFLEAVPVLTGIEIEFEYDGGTYRGLVTEHNTATGQYRVTTTDDEDHEAAEVIIYEEQIIQIYH